ncbi:MAG: hypothetical protein ACYDBQ_00505 [Thermoplasmatota archaeon]
MISKMSLRLLIVAGAAAVFLAFGPGAHAQTASQQLSLDSPVMTPSGPIRVDLDAPTITIPWTYNYNSPALGAQNAAFSTTTITWANPPKCDAKGLTFGGSFQQVIQLPPSPSTTNTGSYAVQGKAVFTVQASQDAPGETAITCTFSASVPAAGQIQGASASAPLIVHVAFRGLLTATVPITIVQAGPQKQIQYSIDLTNLGNSEANVIFSIADDHKADGWQALTPPPVILTSPNKGGTANSQTVVFQISTPYKNGWNNKETTFELSIQPTSTKDVSDLGKGTPLAVSMLARDRGIYIPGPEPALVLIAAVGAALVARASRKD